MYCICNIMFAPGRLRATSSPRRPPGAQPPKHIGQICRYVRVPEHILEHNVLVY